MVAANCDVCRNDRREVIVSWVLHHAAHHTIDVAVDSAESRTFLNDKAHAHMLLLLELHGDGALLGSEHTHLGCEGDASSTIKA